MQALSQNFPEADPGSTAMQRWREKFLSQSEAGALGIGQDLKGLRI